MSERFFTINEATRNSIAELPPPDKVAEKKKLLPDPICSRYNI